jgi:hypothetical protein
VIVASESVSQDCAFVPFAKCVAVDKTFHAIMFRGRSSARPGDEDSVNDTSATQHAAKTFVVPSYFFVLMYSIGGIILFCGVCVLASIYYFEDVVKNSLYQYPDEWWPSVSAALGDYMFTHWFSQYFLAFAVGPRLIAQASSVIYVHVNNSRVFTKHPTFFFLLNVVCYILECLRLLLICTFVIITSSEWHARHDMAAQTHIALTLVYLPLSTWRFARIDRSRKSASFPLTATQTRLLHNFVWFSNTALLIYYFVQHKAHEIPGAYSRFAIHELLLIVFDIVYDMILVMDFRNVRMSLSIL